MGRLAQPLRSSPRTAVATGPVPTPLRLAVVIPALDEEASLAATLRSLQGQSWPPEEVLLVDGGSADRTAGIAQAFGVRVLLAPRRGRGSQIAWALAHLEAEVVVVAHADMIFPPEACAAVRAFMVRDRICPGGCLGHRFARRSLRWKLIELWDRLRVRRQGIAYGDQAQFFRHRLLLENGGFPDQPIMEDVELSLRLKAIGRPVYLDLPVTVSTRRYDRLGYLRTLWSNFCLRRAYLRGGPAVCARIYERYYGEWRKGVRNRY